MRTVPRIFGHTEIPPIRYDPTPTLARFHNSNKFVRGIKGPIGSGKSSGCVMEVYMRAEEQEPYGGVRYTRFAAIRTTYPELLSTTMKTWREWVPEEICPISMSVPITGHMQEQMPDGTWMDMEIVFLALEKEDDVRKLKSLELTGAWVNEASEVSPSIIKMLMGRVGRYPSKRMGGATWNGILMDTNPPDTDSWWHELAVEKKPLTYEFFDQPPAVLEMPRKEGEVLPEFVPNTGQDPRWPAAENVENHQEGYYYWMKQVPGSDPQWIRVFLMGEYGTTVEGKPIYPEYHDDVHASKIELEALRGLPLILGWDFGGCYSDDTEVLTLNGWKHFRDVDPKADRVATLNPSDKEISFAPINYKVEFDYTGDLLRFKTLNMDFLVTPEHRTPFSHRHSPSVISFTSAEDLSQRTRSHQYIQLAGHWSGTPYTLLGLPEELSMRFWGWYLSEGCCHFRGPHAKVTIYQKNHTAELEEVLFDPRWLEIGIRWLKGKDRYQCTSRDLCQHLSITGRAREKYIPPSVKEASRTGIRAFMDAFIAGDGHKRSRVQINSGIGKTQTGEWTCATASVRLKDDLQEMILKAGWCSAARIYHGKGSTMKSGRRIRPSDIWIISVKRLDRAEITPRCVSRVPYKGSVYCLNVPFHTLYVRRNGRPCWNGNTPTVAFCQVSSHGQFRIIDEMSSEDMGIRRFARQHVAPLLATRFPEMEIFSVADPSGNTRGPTNEISCLQELNDAGIPTEMARTNLFVPRREAVAGFLNRMVDGMPGLLVSPRCKMARDGFIGKYRYRIARLSTGEKWTGEPEKNAWSHIHDCIQYAAMYAESGAGLPINARLSTSGASAREVVPENPEGWT